MSIYRYGNELLRVIALAFLYPQAARADWLIRQSGSLSGNELLPFPRTIVVGRTAVKVTAGHTQDTWDLAAKTHIRIDQVKREYWQEPLRAPWIFSNAERPSNGRGRVAGIDCTRYEDSTRREYRRGVVTGNNTKTRYCIAPQITADPSLRENYIGVLEKLFPTVYSIPGFVFFSTPTLSKGASKGPRKPMLTTRHRASRKVGWKGRSRQPGSIRTINRRPGSLKRPPVIDAWNRRAGLRIHRANALRELS